MVQTLRILASSVIFRGGGVLVGTQAFTCYANMLGVRFEQQLTRTADIDVAQPSRDEGSTNTPGAIRNGETRHFAVPGRDPLKPRMTMKARGRDIRIRFLEKARQRSAQPLPEIDYLLEDAVRAVVIGGSGVLVNVPTPARFALHRLRVARQPKDVRQAKQLLEVLTEDRPADISAALRAAEKRPAFAKTIKAALKKL
ncbi:MAG TPA: GSU2403 family nucleotidyltransferase fold protein [Thermoanaerobaculia bacterium]|nr:GSU2403 family nucleotidyltransferase fold protein [Thermoanaerobaculia bacterium]